MFPLSLTALLAFAALSQNALTAAQSSSSSENSYKGCTYPASDYETDIPFNSSGTVAFPFDLKLDGSSDNQQEEDFHLTVVYSHRRLLVNQDKERLAYSSLLRAWLSVPDYIEGSACVYQFRGLNASAESSEEGSCEGALSSECIESLQDRTNAVAQFASASTSECPKFLITDEIRKICGSGAEGTLFPNNLRPSETKERLDLANTTCTVDEPPVGSISNDSHHTFVLPGYSNPLQKNVYHINDTFAWYDLSVQRTIPFLIVAANMTDSRTPTGRGSFERKLACFAPNNVTDGSRVPDPIEGGPESESVASSFTTGLTVYILLGVSLAVTVFG